MDFAALVRLAIDEARASLPDPTTLWIAPELVRAAATPSASTIAPSSRVALALVSVEAVDASGHTSAEVDATRVWGLASGPLRFVDSVLRGARVERVYTLDALLSFDADPVPAWYVRRVATGVSARDVQRASSFPLFAGPDLSPLRSLD